MSGMGKRVGAASTGATRTAAAATATVRCGRVFVAGAMLECGAGRRRILLVRIERLVHLGGAYVSPHFHEFENFGRMGVLVGDRIHTGGMTRHSVLRFSLSLSDLVITVSFVELWRARTG